MNTLLLQTHSNENQKLYESTLHNHLEYVTKHRYDMLQIDINYRDALYDISFVKNQLHYYKTVFNIGSDVIISDINKPISYFEDPEYGIIISKENLGGSILNGDLIIWQNNEKTFKLFDEIEEVIKQINGHPWGIQLALNIIFQRQESQNYIKALPCRELQSSCYSRFPDYAWQNGDFSIHFLNMTNEEKYTKCSEFLRNRNVLWCN